MNFDSDPDSPTPRPTKNKGKGKERALSPSPSPSPKATRSSQHRAAQSLFDADAVYDDELGEYVVFIPWSYRDPEEDSVRDSRVMEIRLGEEGGGCEVREARGVVGRGDYEGGGSEGVDEGVRGMGLDVDGDGDGLVGDEGEEMVGLKRRGWMAML